MKAYIFPNLDKNNCEEYTREACGILLECGIGLLMDNAYSERFGDLAGVVFSEHTKAIPECDWVIVIGGDGTILKCAEAAARSSKPILGINCGRLGFMASLEHEDLGLLRQLKTGGYTLSPRMMLSVTTDDGCCYSALNDVVVSKSDDCKIADFKVEKYGATISYLRADGVIFSTATGSTAYSMSAGGPIIEPDMECIEFTQMCAHSLFARSMVLSPSSEITVTLHCAEGSHAIVNVDGNSVLKITDRASVRISRSELRLDIIDIKGNSFFGSISDKLMQPLKGSTEEILK
ncbi:MAG: NAD(+)/NADH kinase [Ruminococcus sp.]|nr:NAD(+)/NADH kinase [Ruminococcus sp.]